MGGPTMPMPFEKLRLENPLEQPIEDFKYQGRQDPQGLEAPEFEEPVAVPFQPHTFIDSTPTKVGNKLYDDIRNIQIVDLTVEGKVLPVWVLSTGDPEAAITELVVVVHMVKDNPAGTPDMYQATATVFYSDDSFFEFYSAVF